MAGCRFLNARVCLILIISTDVSFSQYQHRSFKGCPFDHFHAESDQDRAVEQWLRQGNLYGIFECGRWLASMQQTLGTLRVWIYIIVYRDHVY